MKNVQLEVLTAELSRIEVEKEVLLLKRRIRTTTTQDGVSS